MNLPPTTHKSLPDATASGMMPISDREFNQIRAFVYEKFGVNLTDQKRSLVVGRLQKLVRSYGFSTFSKYYDHLITDKTGKALDELINRISTNHTFFFRESDHFDYFRQTALPQVLAIMKKQNNRDLRIWCAASSSGEEPYTLAMLMLEFFGNEYGMWNAGILATDVSAKVLHEATTGIYSEEKVRLVPSKLKSRFMKSLGNGQCQVTDQVRNEVLFRRFNLMNRNFPFKKPFHMIFCRNVMIYFDQKTRIELVKKLYANTVPGGYLFIGHSETLRRQDTDYEYVMPAVYRRS